MTGKRTVHQCECANCNQPGEHPDKELHHQMNLLISRLDEQQRRWYIALEANQLGRSGVRVMAEITGFHPDTIRRGQRELAQGLVERPVDRIRIVGGGRKTVEKKSQRWKQ